jgi:phenylalanyl-tRNA synthetase beta chain
VGFVGELHPKWVQAWGFATPPMLFEMELDALTSRTVPAFKPYSKIQAVERDISVWVGEAVTHAQVMGCIDTTPIQPLLRSATLFDVYRPKVQADRFAAEKSLAIRLVLKRDDAVLTESEIDAAVAAVVDRLAGALGARQRA